MASIKQVEDIVDRIVKEGNKELTLQSKLGMGAYFAIVALFIGAAIGLIVYTILRNDNTPKGEIISSKTFEFSGGNNREVVFEKKYDDSVIEVDIQNANITATGNKSTATGTGSSGCNGIFSMLTTANGTAVFRYDGTSLCDLSLRGDLAKRIVQTPAGDVVVNSTYSIINTTSFNIYYKVRVTEKFLV